MMVTNQSGEKVQLTIGTWLGLGGFVLACIAALIGVMTRYESRFTVLETQATYTQRQLESLERTIRKEQ